MSTLPTLGPTLPVTMSRVLKISNEPNLQRKDTKEEQGRSDYITLLVGEIVPQDNTTCITLGKECKDSDYTVEIVIVHPLKDCDECHLGGEVMSILGFCLVVGCHCSCWQYMCMRCHMATIACI